MYLGLFLFLFSTLSWANQTSLTPAGDELYWSNPTVPMVIQTNTSDLSSTQIKNIIQDSMNEWNASSSATINSVNSSINQIKFVSNYPYGSAVLGVTELTYNSAGAIQSAVISLNDDYLFQATPGLYPTGQVFLGDVVTHEIGHLFGLSHSEVLDSSMFYSSFSGQSTVAFDDRSGIRKKYDTEYGRISGFVKGGNNVGVLGAHVQAISRKTGQASGAISDDTGYFSLDGLDLEDTYYLYTSPIKNPNSLPGYFSNVQDEFCPAAYVGSFFTACGSEFDGKPHGVNLSHYQPSVDVGTVTINCSLRSDKEYSLRKLQSTFTALNIYDFADEPKYEKSFVGWFRKPTSSVWSNSDVFSIDLSAFNELSGSSKYLKLALVSYPLGSQLEYEMSVKMNGTTVSNAFRGLSYFSDTETYQTDFSSEVPLSSVNTSNTFEVSIRSRLLTGSYIAQTFPSFGEFSSDQYLPYLFVASLWEMTPQGLSPLLDSGAVLSDNASCLDAPFTYPVNKARTISDSTASAAAAGATGAACGTIDPPNDGPGNSLPLMALGFILVLFSSSLLKFNKKFLS
ncbi:MAG: matrixin family metalloprotease [Bacteriovoracaceae bacterium]|nr:matrixin family metalloprotease [Bacteriovoracaceae bacterium]